MPAPGGAEPISMLPVPGFDCVAALVFAVFMLAIVRPATFALPGVALPFAVLLLEAGEQAAKASRMKAVKASSARRVRVMHNLLCHRSSTEMIIAGGRHAKPASRFTRQRHC